MRKRVVLNRSTTTTTPPASRRECRRFFSTPKAANRNRGPWTSVNVGGFRSNFAERMHEQFPAASSAEKPPAVKASKTPAVSVVCPVKITDHYRRRNWHAWLEQIAAVSQAHEIETIVVTSGELAPVPGIKIVIVPEPFEKSRWMNAGELHATAPRLCFADVDMQLTPDAWSSGFENANAAKFYSPYSKVLWLNRAGADHAIARARYTMRGKGITKRGNLSSGVFFCDRKSFHAIGRWDERFKKWGYEDTAFDHSAKASGLAIEIGSAIATHLWHPAPHRNRDRNESLAIFERFYDPAIAPE